MSSKPLLFASMSALATSLGLLACSSGETMTGSEQNLTDDASDVVDLPFDRASGACPSSVRVGSQGDSYIQGLKFTVDIKGLLEDGSSLTANRVVDTDSEIHVQYAAPLRSDFVDCVGQTAPQDLFNDRSHYVVQAVGGRLAVNVKIDPRSLALDLTSVWANQAIFQLSEQLDGPLGPVSCAAVMDRRHVPSCIELLDVSTCSDASRIVKKGERWMDEMQLSEHEGVDADYEEECLERFSTVAFADGCCAG